MARLVVGLLLSGAAWAGNLEDTSAYANHLAFASGRVDPVLRLVNGAGLEVGGASAAPMGSVSKLYDGNPGTLQDARSWLEFDGDRAELTVDVPRWRRVRNVSFTAAESADEPASASMVFEVASGAAAEVPLERRELSRKGRMAMVEYATRDGVALSDGRLRVGYRVIGLRAARLGEFTLDGIGRVRQGGVPARATARTIGQWKELFAAAQCADVRDRYVQARSGGATAALRSLLAGLDADFSTRVVYWRQVPDLEGGYTTHSLILAVDDTGNRLIDLVRAWIVVPAKPRAPVALVVLPQESDRNAGLEPLGVLGEREMGVAGELARNGVAAATFASIEMGNGAPRVGDYFFAYHPFAGSTAKDVDTVRRLLDLSLDPAFQALAGFAVDPRRVGIWGFSYGAWISLVAGALDERFTAVAFSHFAYRDEDIAPGLSAVLYVPQLACLDGPGAAPLPVSQLLRELAKPVFAVAPDQHLLASWRRGIDARLARVVANPYGHLVTRSERAAVLDFFFRTFSIDARAANAGVVHKLPDAPSGLAPFVERENRWRTRLIDAMSHP